MAIISVVVPVYNVEPFLCRCIESILSQTFTDFDLVLVDDGSPDNCGRICDEYALKDNRIFVIHQKNGGLSLARNVGIDWAITHSQSEWITFIDSDDWVDPAMLKVLYELVIQHGTDIAVCGFKSVGGKEKFANELSIKSIKYSFEDFYDAQYEFLNIIAAWGKLYKKQLFNEIRFPEGKLNEDIFTTYKLLDKSQFIAVIDAPLYYYFDNENSIMRKKWSPKRIDEIEGYEEMIKFMSSNGYGRAHKRIIDTYYWSLDRQIKILEQPELKCYREYRKVLLKKLKRAIRKYRSLVPVSFNERFWLMEDIYPVAMQLYWKIKSLFK